MKQFLTRFINVFAVVFAIVIFNKYVVEETEGYEDKKESIEAYNSIVEERLKADIERQKELEGSSSGDASGNMGADSSSFDGVYEGTGEGYGGSVTVSVTISGGKISNIDIISAKDEDPEYFSMAVGLTDKIISGQTTDVDTVSGATFSSYGIIDAVNDALGNAGL